MWNQAKRNMETYILVLQIIKYLWTILWTNRLNTLKGGGTLFIPLNLKSLNLKPASCHLIMRSFINCKVFCNMIEEWKIWLRTYIICSRWITENRTEITGKWIRILMDSENAQSLHSHSPTYFAHSPCFRAYLETSASKYILFY